MKFSDNVAKVISALNSAGFEAYAVGGCVRDSLLLKTPHDWDIATNAKPEQIKSCFSGEKTINTGIRYGTVTVVMGGENIEVTSYRIDGGYSDGRRPDSVMFTDSLRDDLCRRDFTINALAYHPEHGIVDYFGGRDDINNRVIRCVGDAGTRFSEDALRIFRAVRFSAQLGFEIETKTAAAMEKLAPSLKKISAERVFSELCKTLTGDGAASAVSRNTRVISEVIPEITPMIGFEQHSKYHRLDVFSHTVKALENSPGDLTVRLAVLFHDIGKPNTFTEDENGEGHFYGHAAESARITEERLSRLRCPGDLKSRAVYLVKHHGDEIKPERAAVKRVLNKMGEDTLRQLLALKRADVSATAFDVKGITLLQAIESILDKVLAEGEAFSLNRLAVNGQDLISIGFQPGKKLGAVLDILLDGVIGGSLENERDLLLREAKKHRDC